MMCWAAIVPLAHAERVKDLASVGGVRSNQLIGYGLVVGLDGTGDQTSQAPFTTQSIKNMLARLGVSLPPGVTAQTKNVAAVIVQADLPPFSKRGQTVDVSVSSLANAGSLRGGALLLTPLRGVDGEVYAMAQGNLVVGGFGVAALWFSGSTMLDGLAETMRGALASGATQWQLPDALDRSLLQGARGAGAVVLPWLTLTLLAAICAPAVIGGWHLSLESLRLDITRLDPIAGLARLFSTRAVVELLKSLLKVAFVGICAFLAVRHEAARIAALAALDLHAALPQTCRTVGEAMLLMTVALVAIGAIDAPWQIWSHRRRLRMTPEEMRREYRESEGSPETRARIRDAQQSLARGRMLEDLPGATVVITNPTHYAVALRYAAGRDSAPVVVAKGVDAVAATIRELAARHAVPLVSVPPLARVLYRRVEIGAPIPQRLYTAVAQVLTYVWQVDMMRRTGARASVPLPVVHDEIETWPAK